MIHAGTPSHEMMRRWMDVAVAQARLGLEAGEAPIGSVIVNRAGAIIGRGFNTLRESGNPTLHAEMNAFASAAGRLEEDDELVLVSTLEPCVMCTGAAMQAGVTTIVHGLQAPADAGTGRVSPPTSPGATSPTVIGNIAVAECRALFLEWMERHDGDASRNDQRAFVEQLLELTAALHDESSG